LPVPASKSNRPRYEAAVARLRELYAECGSVLVPDEARRRTETWQTYKHGYEIRFSIRNRSELTKTESMLRVVGIDSGRPYRTPSGNVLPIYGASRVLEAILYLGLRPKPPNRRLPSLGRSVPRERLPAAGRTRIGTRPPARGYAVVAIANSRQLKVAGRLHDRGPLTARELSATGGQLAYLRRAGIVAALPGEDGRPKVWALTPKGIRETRRRRKVYR
jgi:hypothetical protein